MKDTRLFLLVILSFHLICCGLRKGSHVTIKEGISGSVMWFEGNRMPSPDRPQMNSGVPVSRMVYIFEQTRLADVEGEAPLFSKINRKLIARIKANKEGYFQCSLPPGQYSVFTEEPDGHFFANLFDGEGNINSVDVKGGRVSPMDIQVNYKASY